MRYLFFSVFFYSCNSSIITESTSVSQDSIYRFEPSHVFEDFKIAIFRQYPTAQSTSGYLAVNGNIICYKLEKPWKDNQKNISSIPAGIYNGILRYDHNVENTLKLTP